MFERAVWAALLLTVGSTPLLFSISSQDVFRLPKTLVLQTVTLVLVAAVLVWDALHGRLAALAAGHRGPLMLAAAAVLWTGVASMMALNPTVGSGAPLTVLCYAAIFAATILFARRTPALALAALIVPAVINALVVILQWKGLWSPVHDELPAHDRHAYIALQGNPDFAAVYLLLPAIAATAAAVVYRRWRPLLLAALAVILAGLLLTGAFTVYVALAVVFVAFVAVVPSRRARVAMTTLLLVGAILFVAWGPSRNRALSIAKAVMAGRHDEALSFRLAAWSVAWRMFLDHPITGMGPGGYGAHYMTYKLSGDELHPQWMALGNANFGEAHNDPLQLLAETGAPGLALFVIVLWRVGRLSLRRENDGAESAFVTLFALPAAAGFAVTSLAQFPLHLPASASVATFVAALCFAWRGNALR